jgi:hypothetical protein
MRSKLMPEPQFCAQQQFPLHLPRLTECECGHRVGRRQKTATGSVCSSMKTRKSGFWRRGQEPHGARSFTYLDAAVRVGQRLFKVFTMTVVCLA